MSWETCPPGVTTLPERPRLFSALAGAVLCSSATLTLIILNEHHIAKLAKRYDQISYHIKRERGL